MSEMPEDRAQAFIDEFLGASKNRRAKLRWEAGRLAEQTHVHGVDLCMSKATEFSPRIGVLFLAAAKLALMGQVKDKMERYERDIRNHPQAVASYEKLRKSLGR
jgi:hypothetical protein